MVFLQKASPRLQPGPLSGCTIAVTAHHEIVVKPIDLVPDLPELVERHDGPVAPSVLAVHRLAAEAGRVAERVVSGDGCDEVVGGYRRLVAERFHPGFCESRERTTRLVLGLPSSWNG